jgi:pimeloyl-ACP methyl ester carboxylesterase
MADRTARRTDVERFDVKVLEGRTVQVLAAGPADGLPFLFHTGTPAGLVHYQPISDAAADAGLRCVMYSRPGYGGSDPQPGRLVADAAVDVATILDHLGADRFVTAGWSGGGPHALACAALLPERCLAAATIAGVAPYSALGLDWLDGMADENIIEFGAAVSGVEGLTVLLTGAVEQLREVTGAGIVEAFGGLVTAPDEAALTGEFADYLAEQTRMAVASGIAGWRDDDLAFTTDWGFALDDIKVPVTVWQGDQDAMVPPGHGQWLASHVPGARARLVDGEGHLSLVASFFDAICADLATAAPPARN